MTGIFFFGGAQATYSDVEAWRRSALQQNAYLDIFTFPWPTGANPFHPLNDWPSTNSMLLARMVADWRDNDDAYIVGHSSGCAYSNDVAAKVHQYYPHARFHLIVLDGFAPAQVLAELPNTQIWSAKSGGHLSLNYTALEHYPHFKVYEPDHALTKTWGLHFSLVNTKTTDNTAIQTGYLDCNSNLTFLNESSIQALT